MYFQFLLVCVWPPAACADLSPTFMDSLHILYSFAYYPTILWCIYEI